MSALYGINANNDATAARQGAPGAGSTGNNVPAADKHTDDEAINEKPSSSPADTLGKDEEDEDSEMERRTSIVQALARSYSHASGTHPNGQNPFQAGEDSPLNPNSPNFNAREWAKSVVELVHQDGAGFRSAGVCYQNLNVYGYGGASDYQGDVANVWLSLSDLVGRVTGRKRQRIDILRNFDGVVHKGEMLVVLGPPGAGCSTTLKTIAGELNGIYVDEGSYFNYQGMTAKEMHSHHRGEAIYTAEIDVHFPMLSVGDTLTFAARARQPRQLPQGLNRNDFADHLRDVVMAMFGISHTVNTRVGNEYIRGVSGGERKRVTISEAALSGAPLQCWDNSTRGLDSANAIEFCKTLRLQTELFNNTAVVSIYQSPQSAYDLFDKATVIYEGRQIFFGRADAAKQYFINLGFECPARQTTPDFLTSMTAPNERIVRDGFKGQGSSNSLMSLLPLGETAPSTRLCRLRLRTTRSLTQLTAPTPRLSVLLSRLSRLSDSASSLPTLSPTPSRFSFVCGVDGCDSRVIRVSLLALLLVTSLWLLLSVPSSTTWMKLQAVSSSVVLSCSLLF
uniref:ABC transporter domain-containing protein n=1 Tax=Fusarium oxysporum (strain Fo5176) TaxID=660025 RepID=A0A0D2XGE2_FUSOF